MGKSKPTPWIRVRSGCDLKVTLRVVRVRVCVSSVDGIGSKVGWLVRGYDCYVREWVCVCVCILHVYVSVSRLVFGQGSRYLWKIGRNAGNPAEMMERSRTPVEIVDYRSTSRERVSGGVAVPECVGSILWELGHPGIPPACPPRSIDCIRVVVAPRPSTKRIPGGTFLGQNRTDRPHLRETMSTGSGPLRPRFEFHRAGHER